LRNIRHVRGLYRAKRRKPEVTLDDFLSSLTGVRSATFVKGASRGTCREFGALAAGIVKRMKKSRPVSYETVELCIIRPCKR
jgi:hypothetical protein